MGVDQLQRRFHGGEVVERQGGVVLRVALAVRSFGVFFLQLRRIGQEDFHQVGGGLRAVDAAAEAEFHQHGQVAGVVDVRMTNDDRGDLARIEIGLQPVTQPEFLDALEEAGIKKDLLSPIADEVLRAGDSSGSTEEL